VESGVRSLPGFATPQYGAGIGEIDLANSEHVVMFQEKMRTATLDRDTGKYRSITQTSHVLPRNETYNVQYECP